MPKWMLQEKEEIIENQEPITIFALRGGLESSLP
jgi:hypothetical protein